MAQEDRISDQENEKAIFLSILPEDYSEFYQRFSEFDIQMIPVSRSDFLPPSEATKHVLHQPFETFRLVDSPTLSSKTLLDEMLGRPDINAIRLLKFTYLAGNSVLCLSRPKESDSWKDGEDFWTFAEHADEFRSLLWNKKSVYFRVYGFGRAPGSRPSPELLETFEFTAEE